MKGTDTGKIHHHKFNGLTWSEIYKRENILSYCNISSLFDRMTKKQINCYAQVSFSHLIIENSAAQSTNDRTQPSHMVGYQNTHFSHRTVKNIKRDQVIDLIKRINPL